MCKRNTFFFSNNSLTGSNALNSFGYVDIMTSFIRAIAIVVATTSLACSSRGEAVIDQTTQTCELFDDSEQSSGFGVETPDAEMSVGERIWLVSTRGLPFDVPCANLENPKLRVYRLNPCGDSTPVSLKMFESMLSPSRPLVVYVHGNLIDKQAAAKRGLDVYRAIRSCRRQEPVDWVIWSWPSSFEGCRLIKDFRRKADRTDAQGLYLAWFLRRQVQSSMQISMIGYSFGSRVISGSLHALAGGSLDGRRLGGSVVTGAKIYAGWIAPAMESTWMCPNGYHGRATKNLQELLILYSRRDAILKRYWLIDRVRNSVALGYSGPQGFGPRADGTPLPVRSRDCAGAVGIRHDELEYYEQCQCNATAEMARLINVRFTSEGI